MDEWIFVRRHSISGYAYLGTHVVRIRARGIEEAAEKLALQINKKYPGFQEVIDAETLLSSSLFDEAASDDFQTPVGTIYMVHPDDYEEL